MIKAAVFGVIKNGVPEINERYFEHIRRCGAKAEAVYPKAPRLAAAEYDCLVVCGGGDMDPALYGQSPWKRGLRFEKEHDRYELELIRAFTALKKPIIGICKGMQSINVALGGMLTQDIPSMLSLCHSSERGELVHEIKVSPDALLHNAVGLRAVVNSYHHQCVSRLGDGLRRAAVSHDGVTEAIEGKTLPVLGVQWHPERERGNRVFEHFFNSYF